jgi:hypothetical protein
MVLFLFKKEKQKMESLTERDLVNIINRLQREADVVRRDWITLLLEELKKYSSQEMERGEDWIMAIRDLKKYAFIKKVFDI